MTTRQELRKLMKHRGWTIYRLAKEMEMTYQTVHGWVTGAHSPKGLYLHLLDRFLEKHSNEKGEIT